jgi:DNA repair exonuclease SbcCD nuclease subunit
VLKVLHTADWHLGRRFPSFPEEAQKKLSRARMEVIARVFDVARRNGVGAVLCAGDLFDEGDKRIRIGCVHGCTFDMEGYQTNFPISRDAGVQRGLDYLAIGDTHSFRDVTESLPVPTVYPGAPEATNFDEPQSGNVVLVALFRHGIRPRIEVERVAFWRWLDVRCCDMTQLRRLLTTPDLDRHVVRLRLDMSVSLSEENEVERILRELQGTDAAHGRAGILLVDKSDFRLLPGSGDIFPENLPPVVRDTIARLDRIIQEADDDSEKLRATRALGHLYRLLQSSDVLSGKAR